MTEYIVADAQLYSNYILTSSLITSPTTSATSNASSILEANYNLSDYTMEDYSDLSNDAIAAYQAEINKGTVNNPDIIESSVLFNSLFNSEPFDLTSVSYGLTGSQIYSYYSS